MSPLLELDSEFRTSSYQAASLRSAPRNRLLPGSWPDSPKSPLGLAPHRPCSSSSLSLAPFFLVLEHFLLDLRTRGGEFFRGPITHKGSPVPASAFALHSWKKPRSKTMSEADFVRKSSSAREFLSSLEPDLNPSPRRLEPSLEITNKSKPTA